MSESSIESKESELRLPSREQCLKMLHDSKYELPEGRKEHVLKVNKIVMELGKALREAGEDIDLDVLDRASLLHDIMKETGEGGHHCKSGADLVRREGWDGKMAEAIELHGGMNEEMFESENWETKLLNYVDRRNDGNTGQNMTIEAWIKKKMKKPGREEKLKRLKVKFGKLKEELNNILSKIDKNLEEFFRE